MMEFDLFFVCLVNRQEYRRQKDESVEGPTRKVHKNRIKIINEKLYVIV